MGGHSKRRAQRTSVQEEADFLIQPQSHTRTWHTGGDIYREDPEHRNHVSRCVVILVSMLLVLGGIALAVLARIEKEKKIFPLCPRCNDLIIAMYIAGACVALVGAIGLVGAATRVRVLAIVFTVLVIVMSLALLAAGIAVTIYHSGLHQGDLRTLWDDAVRDDSDVICDLQLNLQCSGFDHCCNVTAKVDTVVPSVVLPSVAKNDDRVGLSVGNTTTPAAVTTPAPTTTPFPLNNLCDISPEEYDKQCSPHCATSNGYVNTCHEKVENDVKRHLVVILSCLYGGGVVLFATAVASIRMVLKS